MSSTTVDSPAARTVVAHRHQLIRSGLAALLAGLEELDVVAEVPDFPHLVETVAAGDADLIVMDDASMSLRDGTTTMASLTSRYPGLKWLVLGTHESAETVTQAVCCGASGYLREDASEADFFAAVRALARGGSYFGAEIASAVARAGAKPRDPLTERQEEVLALIAIGLSSEEIASQLGLSPKTVSAHRTRIAARLGMNDVPSLTRYAMRNGLAPL